MTIIIVYPILFASLYREPNRGFQRFPIVQVCFFQGNFCVGKKPAFAGSIKLIRGLPWLPNLSLFSLQESCA
jgi:hypothetical protein